MSLLGELLGITLRWVKRENLRPDALPLAMDEFLTPQRSQPAAAKPSATLATGAKRVRVPDDLEAISADDLCGLVKKLCVERTAMERAASGSSWSSSMAPPPSAARPGKATAAQSTPAPPLAAPKATELAAMKKRLADKSAKAIKKTKHNDKRKPYTEVNEGMPNKATALALLEGLAPKSDTLRMTRWLIEGDAAAAWLGIERLVHPVTFDGKIWCLRGERPQVYAWAGIETLEIRYEASSNLLSLKFRTFIAGNGLPQSAPE